jgi:hypothetical protein
MDLQNIINEALTETEKHLFLVTNRDFNYKKETMAVSKSEAKSNVAYNFADEFSRKLGKPIAVLRKEFLKTAMVYLKK